MKTEHLLTKKLAELSRNYQVLEGDVFGIELENEAEAPFDVYKVIHSANNAKFRVDKDPSLRGEGAFEFVSQPLKKENLLRVISEFTDDVQDINWSNSRRTSTHIHMNFSDKTCFDLAKFMTLYWIFEKVLLLSVKETRLDNTFCFSSATTRELLISLVENHVFTVEHLNNPNAYKYNSINIAPLATQGTAEIRVFHGTMKKSSLLFWVEFLDKLLQVSREYTSLKEILDDFNETPASIFLLKILKKEEVGWLKRVAVKRGTTIEDELREGFRYATPVFKLNKAFSKAAEAATAVKNLQEYLDNKLKNTISFIELVEEEAPF